MNRSDQEHHAHRAVTDEGMGERRAREARATHRRIEWNHLREVGKNLGGQIDAQVRRRPYVAVGAAAGIGFVAGSFLGSRLGQMLLAAAIGFAAKSVLEGDLSAETVRTRLEKLAGPSD